MLEAIGGVSPGDSHAFRVFRNPGSHNNWLNVKLVGVHTNKAAIGARIEVTVEDDKHEKRTIFRTVGSGGSFGANPIEQHIGLGAHAKILKMEVWWPASNTRQSFMQVDANQFVEIREFGKTYTRLRRKSFVVGSSSGMKTAASGEQRQ